jgi:dihydroorotate dehydrogenase (NAD+) catalytic subunit
VTAIPLEKVDLRVQVGRLSLKNPVIAASGVFGYGLDLSPFCPPERLGAVIVKGLSAEPWPGNPGHRIAESAGGLINSVGLQNMGARAFAAGPLREAKAVKAVVGANVVGRSEREYVLAAEILADSEVDFLELNISCPNLSAGGGGLSFGSDPDAAARLTSAVAAAVKGSKPLWVKLPPLVSDIGGLARRVAGAGAEAISLINTLPALAIDLESRKPLLGNVTGGLSGPPIKPLALRQVRLASLAVDLPVVGLGGALTAADALELMVAGASAVQLGTAILMDPSSPLAIIGGMADWLAAHGIERAASLTGTLKT